MTALPHSLDRSVVIRARPDTVFRYFTDSARFAAWWGEGSSIDARPGGAVRIVNPGGMVVSGSVVAVKPVKQISFTYGYETMNSELIPAGGSLVTVTVEQHQEGTLLHLKHDFSTTTARDAHVPGWRYQMAVFANVATREEYGSAESLVDRYFAVWSEPDAGKRHAELKALGANDLIFRDGFGLTTSPSDLADHIGATQMHMPGMRMERDGALRQCQGTGIANWVARAPDGSIAARGSNVFDFAPGGRITRVVGLWAN
jgi:uncharacterized protein YndB with AHSA1/START domain